MDKIILLILLNIFVYYLIRKNIYLLISLFIFMVFYILKMKKKKTIEGNTDYYELNFWNSLKKDTNDNNNENNNLYNELIEKLNSFLKRYIDYQETPIEQPCIGEFNEWSKCSTKCGIGSKYKTYNVIQRKGEGGIDCIYENGEIQSSECFERPCKEFEDCKEDMDCDSRFYCNPQRKRCEVKDGCDINNLQNCNLIECGLLGKNYHYNTKKGCDEYILKTIIEKPSKSLINTI